MNAKDSHHTPDPHRKELMLVVASRCCCCLCASTIHLCQPEDALIPP